MKLFRSLAILGSVTAAALVVAAPAASAATPTKHTVASVRAHVDVRASHITAKAVAMRTRVTANTRLAAAGKSAVLADITKVLTDTAAWRKQIDAATTMTAIKAAAPAQRLVTTDLTKLHTDYTTMHAKLATGR